MNLFSDLKVYVILDRKIGAPVTLYEQAERSIEGGAMVIQLRDKELSGAELYREALEIAGLCRKKGVLFIVNDRVDVALASGADGVHLGQRDMPCLAARKIVPGDFIVGVTVRDPRQAARAELDGADYLGVGALFRTKTKSDTEVIGPEGLAGIRKEVSLPLVAIGGIDKSNALMAFESGADGVALVSSVVARKDITSACRDISSSCRAESL